MRTQKKSPGLVVAPQETVPLQLLAEDGTYTPNSDYPLDLEPDVLLDLYRLMVTTRELDAESIRLQRQGQLAVYASCLGQEAAQVGSAYALREEDWVFPSYREHGVAVVKGVDAVDLLGHSRGTWCSCHDPRAQRFAPQTVPIATHLLHASGVAHAGRLRGESYVAVAYFGDGGTSEGDAHEGMNFAAVYRAPVIFFCQNNGYAISVPIASQMGNTVVADRAVAYGMPGFRVDGNDVLACLAVMRRAVAHARDGNGPVLIEAMTYRREPHSTADDDKRYRPQEEVPGWVEKDPLARYERFLEAQGLMTKEHTDRVADEVSTLLKRVRDEIYDAPHGDPLELFEHVYQFPHPRLAQQRAQLAAILDSEREA